MRVGKKKPFGSKLKGLVGERGLLDEGLCFSFQLKKRLSIFWISKKLQSKFFSQFHILMAKMYVLSWFFSEMVVGGGSFLCSVFDIYYGKVEGRSNGFTAHYNLLLCILRF